jgi:hypothetical protein
MHMEKRDKAELHFLLPDRDSWMAYFLNKCCDVNSLCTPTYAALHE